MLTIHLEKKLGDMHIDVRFTAPGKAITVLSGHSGAGKTSVINMVAGITNPGFGFIQINGRILVDTKRNLFIPPEKRDIGYIFQDKRLFPFLSVKHNLCFGQKRSAKQNVLFDEVVQLLDIGHLLSRSPQTLSGGEEQRIAIGRALLAEPQLLLMDEPLSSLDDSRKNEIIPYIASIPKQFGIPIILVTHSPFEVAKLADHIVVLNNGKNINCSKSSKIDTQASSIPWYVERKTLLEPCKENLG